MKAPDTRPEPFSSLRHRNERRARVLAMLEAKREQAIRHQRESQVQRDHNLRRGR